MMSTELITKALEQELRSRADKILAEEVEEVVARVRSRLAESVGPVVLGVLAEYHVMQREERIVIEFRPSTKEKT